MEIIPRLQAIRCTCMVALLGAGLVCTDFLTMMAEGDRPCLAADSPTKPYKRPRSAECRWVIGKIKIDGRADEPAWKQAQVIDTFAAHWDKRPAKTGTKARLLWDERYIYFFAEMEDHDLYAKITEDDGMTWHDDVFEMFFKPSRKKPGYYEFHVTPAGTRMDMFIPKREELKFEVTSKADEFHMERAVVKRGTLNKHNDRDFGWSVEGRLPWSDFSHTGGPPKAGQRWMFALCRYDYSTASKKPDLSTTAPLSKLNFHLHEDYGELTFVGPMKK